MRKLTLVLSMLIALIGFNANAAMYIVGSDIFGDWNPGGGVEMTNNGDGTYSYTATVDGTVYFVFGDGLNNNWDIFNSNYRYGPTNGDTNISAGNWITTQKAGDHGSYVFSGSGEEYVFTFDETNHRFKVEGNVAPFNPYTGKLFILGQVNGNNWNPSTGIEMNLDNELIENIYVLNDVTVTDSGDGYGYFSFTTKLGENVDDWSFLPYRRGAVENGVLVENNRKTAMGAWGTDYAFKILPGTYDFTVSIMEGESAYVKAVKKADPEPVVDDVFIIGDVNNFSTAEGWDPTKGAQMTLADSVYTATVNAVVRDGQEYAYFGFSKKIAEAESETPWDDIEAFRFGPVSEGDFLMTQELLGTNCALATDGSHASIAIPAGEWTVTVNLVNNTFSINGEWPVDTVVPEPAVDVFIIGDVNNFSTAEGWDPTKGAQMTLADSVYTATVNAVVRDGQEYAYFGFTKKIAEAESETPWDDIEAFRFGPVSEGDFLMTQELLGTNCALATDGSYASIAIPAGEWAVTVNLANNTFSINGEWPVDTIVPEPAVDVFIIGDVNNFSTAEGWDPTKGAQMTLADSVYTATVNAVVRDGQEYAYFGFTKKIADPESETPWDDIEAFRFGPVSDGDFLMTQELLGTNCALATDGSYASIAIPAGEWAVTVNLANNTFSINGEWPVDTIVPEPAVDVFIIGDVNNFSTAEGWDPTKGAQMTLADSVYTATVNAVVRDGQEYAYFGFTKKIADSESETPWDDIEAFRFGPVSDGDFIMTEELLGTNCALATDGSYASIAIPAGEWAVTVDLANNTFSINGEWPVDTIVPEPYTGNVYILGEVNNNGGWFTNKGVLMTRDAENNVYTATITTAGENIPEGEETGYSYFSFTKQLADSAAAWDEIAPYRFGAVSEGDYWVTDEVLGTVIPLQNNGQSFRVPAGKWNLTLSVDNMTLVIEAVNVLRGDVNEDNNVSIADVTALIDYLLSGDATGVNSANADCNLDENVSIADVTALIDYLLSGSWPAK